MIGIRPRQQRRNGNGIPHRVHLVGAGGIHMSGIGQILLQRGHVVTGSDLALSEHTRRLVIAGLVTKVYLGRNVVHSLSFYGKSFVDFIKTFSHS